MELEKLYANLGRLHVRADGLQAELNRLSQAREQLLTQILAAEQEAAKQTKTTEPTEAPA